MFINDDQSPTQAPSIGQSFASLKKPLITVAIFVFLGFVGWAIVLHFYKKPVPAVLPVATSTTIILGNLPTASSSVDLSDINNTVIDNIKAENFLLPGFYTAPVGRNNFLTKGLVLPMNIKTQVDNYYDVARQIKLDAGLDHLDKQGFAILDNPAPDQAADWFAAYNYLSRRGVPLLITDDFLVYYYQNNIKQLYQTIEGRIFYQNLWYVSKALFATADQRYRQHYLQIGVSNDPVLQGERQEAAYFAVMLELLKPKAAQITDVPNDPTAFSAADAQFYTFSVPDYLTADVNNEVGLITAANTVAKSPVMFYPQDYQRFALSDDQKKLGAKLINFSLAGRWANQLFPLYYQSPTCPDCALDKSDWLVESLAAQLISQDLAADQKIKNRWARVYKVISYFTGLHGGLSYLYYQQAFDDTFGSSTVEQAFDASNQNRDSQLALWQQKLAAINFSPLTGALPNNSSTMNRIGLRLLQTDFWPSDYLFNVLTGQGLGKQNKFKTNQPTDLITGCQADQTINRCRGFGFDWLAPLTKAPNVYYNTNQDYQFYGQRLARVKAEIDRQAVDNWSTDVYYNIFWSDFAVAQQAVNFINDNRLAYTAGVDWPVRNINLGIATLLNAQLPADTFSAQVDSGVSLNTQNNHPDYDMVEPNGQLIKELAANEKMLSDGLSALGVIQKDDLLLTGLRDQLSALATIVDKEASGQNLNDIDRAVLKNLVGRTMTQAAKQKSITYNFINGDHLPETNLTMSLNGLKFLVVVQAHDGKQLLSVGPIFNYQETQ